MAKTTSQKQQDSRIADPPRSVWRTGLRGAFVWLLIIIGSLSFSSFVIVHWAERQVLDTESWVSLVGPLPEQEVVYTALGSYVSRQVFSAAPVEQTIAEALPPRAVFLAGPLTDQLQTLTTKASQKIVGSENFQTVWVGANRLAMNRLLTTARTGVSPLQTRVHERFNIDLSGVSAKVRDALGSTATAIPALQATQAKAITLSADLQSRPERVRQAIRMVDSLYVILPVLVTASFLGAFALSYRRRHTAVMAVLVLAVCMLLELIELRWMRGQVIGQVRHVEYVPAISYIYDALVEWLRHMIFWVLGILAVLYAGLYLAGPSTLATRFRTMVHLERLGDSKILGQWRARRLWLKQWEYRAWLIVILLVLVAMALFVDVNTRAIINAVLLSLGLIAAIHIFASPPRSRLTG